MIESNGSSAFFFSRYCPTWRIREYGYDKFFTADASPRIFDMIGFFTEHAEMNKAIWNLVDNLDRAKYRKLMHEERHMDLMKLVRKEIYRL